MPNFNSKSIWGKILATLGMLFGSVVSLAADPVWYVQSATAEMRAEATGSAPSIRTLTRGAQVTKLGEKGLWMQVQSGSDKGWTNKLFLSPHAPIGQAALLSETNETIEKSSRKRAPAYSVAASARGLMTDERKRMGQEKYKTDYEALKKMERSSPSEQQATTFWKQGGLK